MSKGLFFVLEGIDGSGTSTQLHQLEALLLERGFSVHTTAEPTTGPIGQFIRDVLEKRAELSSPGLALAFAADRLHHLQAEIIPKLDAGTIVLADRYVLSSLAYQGLDNPLTWVEEINKHALTPSLSILVRVSPEVAAERRAKRGTPAELFDAAEKQRAIAEAYDRVFLLPGYGPKVVVDGSASMEAVTAALLAQLTPSLAPLER